MALLTKNWNRKKIVFEIDTRTIWPAELGIDFLQSAFSLRSVDILVTVGT